jgi:hypothetical protein
MHTMSTSDPNLSDDYCPTCQTRFLTKPKASQGYHTPENVGGMYQQVFLQNFFRGSTSKLADYQCSGNTHGDDSLCSGFVWRPDLDLHAKVGKLQPCQGPGCLVRPKAKALHQKCIRRFCIDCCRDAMRESPTQTCTAPKHKREVMLMSDRETPLVRKKLRSIDFM